MRTFNPRTAIWAGTCCLGMLTPCVLHAGVPARAANPRATVSNIVVAREYGTPFSVAFDLRLAKGTASQSFQVPPGARLVIDYVSADGSLTSSGSVLFDLVTVSHGQEMQAHMPMMSVNMLGGSAIFALSNKLTLDADGGSKVTLSLRSASRTGGLAVAIYGHFADLH
jgi:hypothetical protein